MPLSWVAVEFASQSMIFHDLMKGALWDPTLTHLLPHHHLFCLQSEEGKGSAVGSTGTEFHLHERAPSLLSCGAEGHGLEHC